MDGRLNWEKDISYFSYSYEELENWQNRLHEVSALHCNQVKKALLCISSEVRYFLYYDGLSNVNIFLEELEKFVP